MARNGRESQETEDPGWGEGSRYAAHLDRGWSLLEKGDVAAARTSATEAHELRSDDPDAPMLLGAVALAGGDAEEALRCYEQAAEIEPEYLEALAAAASVCLFDLRAPDRALSLCERALELALGPLESLDLHLLAAEAELALKDDAAARARLGGLAELEVLAAAIQMGAMHEEPAGTGHDDPGIDSAEAAAASYLFADPDGDPLDEDDQANAAMRVLGHALRLARLWLDLGTVEEPRELLRLVVDAFPGEPDAWHLLSESEYLAGDMPMATHAAMRTRRLDELEPGSPDGLPSPALLHARIVEILRDAPVPELRALVDRPVAFSVLVEDVVPAELVLEGMDPRVAVLALMVRAGPGATEAPGWVSGVAAYRRGLARLGRTAAEFDDQLKLLLYEELALALELVDNEREQLGLAPLGPPVGDPPRRKRKS